MGLIDISERPASQRPRMCDGRTTPWIARGFVLLFLSLSGCGGGSSGSGGTGGNSSPPPTIPVVEYAVGGNVSGLAGSGLVLRNGSDTVAVMVNGNFAFTVTDGGGYDVRVAVQPGSSGELCAVTNGSGTVAGANINNIVITCTPYHVTEYSSPGNNVGLVRGSDGNLWGLSRQWDDSSNNYTNELYRIDPNGSPVVIPVPLSENFATTVNSIADLFSGPDGQLWFLSNPNVMARTTLAGMCQTVAALPGGNGFSFPFISPGPVDREGQVWFWNSPTIGRMDATGAITLQRNIPDANIGSMALGPDGNIWFTASGIAYGTDGNVGSVVGFIITSGTTAGEITIFRLPPVDPPINALAGGIAVGPDGNLWITERGQFENKIAKVTPAGIVTEYPVSTPGSYDLFSFITPGPDGALWFTGQGGNQIGQITTDGAVTLFTVPTANGNPTYITTGPDGRIWFSQTNKVAAIGGLTIPVPGNNNFANADAISGATGHLQTNNFSASAETGEPEHATGVAPQKTLWWRWTAPADGQVTVNTHGSSHETVIGVYTGATLGALTQVAQGHQRGNGVSFVTFTVTANTTYYIAVDGYNGASGVLMLDWRMP